MWNSPFLRGTRGIVLLSSRVWKDVNGWALEIGISCNYSNPFITRGRKHTHTHTQPPKLADVILRGGGLRVCMALKAPLCSGDDKLPQHWSVLRAIHTLNSPKNYICLLGGFLPIHTLLRRGAQGLMCGTRGPFLLVAVMVGYCCVGWCFLLDANARSIYCRSSNICLQKFPAYILYILDIQPSS